MQLVSLSLPVAEAVAPAVPFQQCGKEAKGQSSAMSKRPKHASRLWRVFSEVLGSERFFWRVFEAFSLVGFRGVFAAFLVWFRGVFEAFSMLFGGRVGRNQGFRPQERRLSMIWNLHDSELRNWQHRCPCLAEQQITTTEVG